MQLVCWRLLVERNAAYVQFQDAPLPEVQVKMYVTEHILFVGYHISTFSHQRPEQYLKLKWVAIRVALLLICRIDYLMNIIELQSAWWHLFD